MQDARIRTRIKAAIAGNIRRGEGQREFKMTVDAEFDRAGMTRIAPHAIQNIYETNVSLAYGAGQMSKMLEVSDSFPYWKYSATMDGKTRQSHVALHGKIFRTGDFTFFPPIGFRCRCTAIPLTARQAGRYPQSDMPDGDQKHNLYNTLESKEFAGDKQKHFMTWAARQYAKADPQTRTLMDGAFDTMKSEIRTLEYESAKEFFRSDYVKVIEKEFLKNKRVQREAKKLGLTQADSFRIYAYTDADNKLSSDMARMHYTNAKPGKWSKNELMKFKKDMARTATKLPTYAGVVYRNLPNVDKATLQQWRKGATVIWDGFSSTSMNAKVFNSRDIKIVIRSKNARIIGDLSKWANEKEALLLPGTRLKILGVKDSTIYADEL